MALASYVDRGQHGPPWLRSSSPISPTKKRTAIAAGAIAFLPTGATEAHGPHLPLATDVVISREAAKRAARLLRDEGLSALERANALAANPTEAYFGAPAEASSKEGTALYEELGDLFATAGRELLERP